MTHTVEHFVAALSATVLGTAILFVWTGEARLGLCAGVYIIEALALNQLAVHMSKAVRKRLAAVDRVLVAAFALVAVNEFFHIFYPVLP